MAILKRRKSLGNQPTPVEFGGTGVSSLTDGGVLMGSGSGAITASAVLGDGEILVGDGTTDPTNESGATLRSSIGLGTSNTAEFASITGVSNVVIATGTGSGWDDWTVNTTSSTEYIQSRITITPTSSNSSICIVWAIQCHINMLTLANRSAMLTLGVGNSDTGRGVISMRCLLPANQYNDKSLHPIHIDNPGVTTAVTYSLFANNNDASTVYWQHSYAGTHRLKIMAFEFLGCGDKSWDTT